MIVCFTKSGLIHVSCASSRVKDTLVTLQEEMETDYRNPSCKDELKGRSRKPGRSMTRWIDQIKSLAGLSSLQDLYSLAKDRQRCRAIVDVTSCQS